MWKQVELLEGHAGHGAVLGDDFFRVAHAFATDVAVADVLAVEANMPALKFFKQVHATQQGGLARAAGTDQGHDVAALHAQVDAFEHFNRAVGFVQPFDAQQRRGGSGLSLCHGKATRFSICRPRSSMA